jgi:hypothetical protein
MTRNGPQGCSSYISQVRPQAGKNHLLGSSHKLNQANQTEPDFER